MSDFTTIKKTADEMQAEFKRVANEFQDKMRGMFTDMTKSFFEAAPEIKLVVWNQYTPYFNDGDECVFGVNDAFFLTEFDEDELQNAYDYEDSEHLFNVSATKDDLQYYIDAKEKYGESSYYDQKIASISKSLENPRNSEISGLCKALSSVISDNEDLMKAVFGDHVTVYLTPGKSFTEEYSHD